VDQSLDEILKQTEDFGLDAVQLHGDEDEEFCATVNKRVLVIKAIRMEAGRKAQGSIERFATSCSYFLFDTSTADQFGGTGKQFNWSDLAEENIPLRFFLSGGIGPGDLNAVKEFNKKIQVHAVDINSRFETAPGIKDLELVKQFSEALKSVQL
jgi:phosphoribosylanthranilate isomerase